MAHPQDARSSTPTGAAEPGAGPSAAKPSTPTGAAEPGATPEDATPEDATDRAARTLKQLTLAEALRALYIDFEGRIDKPPVLLGIHRRGRGARPYVQQDVVDERFTGLVPRYMPLHDAILNVVRRADAGDRRIVAWSHHELNVVRALLADDPELVARFTARYVDARAVAKRWRNKLHAGDRPDETSLANYLALIAYEVPEDAAPGRVGSTLGDLADRLDRGLPLTSGQLVRWDRLVEHNRFDCAGMRAVCLQAARELEAAAELSGAEAT